MFPNVFEGWLGPETFKFLAPRKAFVFPMLLKRSWKMLLGKAGNAWFQSLKGGWGEEFSNPWSQETTCPPMLLKPSWKTLLGKAGNACFPNVFKGFPLSPRFLMGLLFTHPG